MTQILLTMENVTPSQWPCCNLVLNVWNTCRSLSHQCTFYSFFHLVTQYKKISTYWERQQSEKTFYHLLNSLKEKQYRKKKHSSRWIIQKVKSQNKGKHHLKKKKKLSVNALLISDRFIAVHSRKKEVRGDNPTVWANGDYLDPRPTIGQQTKSKIYSATPWPRTCFVIIPQSPLTL